MFACLYVPDFPVQAVLLSEPSDDRESLWRSPVVVLDGPANLPKAAALNDPARNAGITVGMTTLQAEICGGVAIRKRCAESEEAAQAALVECASNFSPRVESASPGAVILDLTGTEKLLGSAQNIACKIAVRSKDAGFHLRIAIASNPDTALLAAKGFRGITIIPAGDEAKILGPLRVGVLSLEPETARILDAWGIHTLKALAALPTIALVERLKQEGYKLQSLAQGKTTRPLLIDEPAPDFVGEHEFDDPIETIELLSFDLNRVLHEVCDRLIDRSLATNAVRLTLDLEVQQRLDGTRGEKYEHHLKLPLPTQDRKMIFTLLRLELERQTFCAPIRKLTVELAALKPRTTQGHLFAPTTPDVEKLEVTLSRFRGIVGSADIRGIPCVGTPALLDTHEAGAFTVEVSSRESEISHQFVPACVPMQVFRPPLETSVKRKDGIPSFVNLLRRDRPVLVASGPWCSSGNWWNEKRWAREEWDVALDTFEGVGYYRIYLDRIKKQWFVDAVSD